MTRLAKLKLTSDLTDQMSGLTGGAVSRVSAGTYIDSDGVLQTAWGNRDQLIPTNAQADTDNWDGSGPWTLTVAVTADTSYVLSVHLNGPTVSVAEDTATLDTTGSATYGSELVFTCTAAGDITITTDTADPMVMLEALPSGNVIGSDLFDQEALGNDLVINGDLSAWTGDDPDNWTVVNEDANNYVTESNGAARLVSDDSAVLYLWQDITVTPFTPYKLTFDIAINIQGWRMQVIDVGGGPGGGNLNLLDPTNFTNEGSITQYYMCRGTKLRLIFYRYLGAASDYTLDNVSVKEVTGPPRGIPANDPWPALAGSELVTDGDCSTDSFNDDDDGWSYDATNDEYDCDGSQTGLTGLTQDDIGLIDGKLHRVEYEVKNYSAGEVWIWLGNETGLTTTHQSANGVYSEYLYLSAKLLDRVAVRADADFIGSVTNISVCPVQVSWVPYNNNTIEIDETEDALKITCVDVSTGAYVRLRTGPGGDLSKNLTVGESYLFELDAKVSSGATLYLKIESTPDAITGNIAESWTHYDLVFIADDENDVTVNFQNMDVGDIVYIRNQSIRPIPDAAMLEASDFVNSYTIPAKARFEANGLLVEGESTILLQYPRDFTNSVWIKNNITPSLDQIGLDGKANSTSKLLATAANGTVFQTIPTVQKSGPFTTSFWVRRITGTGLVYMSDDNGSNYTEITLTTSWQRFEIERTQTQPAVGFKIVTNGDAIAVDGGMVEYLPYATSIIPATISQVTRTSESADGTYGYMWSLASALQAALADKGTLIIEWTPKFSAADGSGTGTCILTFEPSATGFLYYDFDNTDFEITDGTNIVLIDKSIVKDSTYKLIVRWHKTNNNLALSLKEGSSWTHATPGSFDGSFPHTGDKFFIHYGSEFPANFKDLYIFDQYFSDAEIEAGIWRTASGLLSAAFTVAKPSMTFTVGG